MASAAEQLAANINFQAFSKATELKKRIWFTLAALQAYGISVGLEGQGHIVTDPGLFFRASTVITLTGGTVFLMWLGEQITSRGIGNGTSLIIFSGIVAGLPNGLAAMLELGRTGQLAI